MWKFSTFITTAHPFTKPGKTDTIPTHSRRDIVTNKQTQTETSLSMGKPVRDLELKANSFPETSNMCVNGVWDDPEIPMKSEKTFS